MAPFIATRPMIAEKKPPTLERIVEKDVNLTSVTWILASARKTISCVYGIALKDPLAIALS